MGIRIEGDEGWVQIWRNKVDAYPKSLLQVRISSRDRIRLVEPDGEPIRGFIDCVRKRTETCAPIDIAHRSTNLCSIAAISMLLGRKVVWDPVREEFPGDAPANRLRARAMREPWSV
jgi:hypothetical protein